MLQSLSRPVSALYWLAFTGLTLLPMFLVLVYRAEILTIGNESLAYRCFFSYGVLNDQGNNIFFLQGYTLSAVQNVLLLLSGAREIDVHGQCDALNKATMAFNASVLIAAATAASVIREITWTDRIMRAILGLGSMYATAGLGLRFALWSDYYHLDVAIAALSLVLFQIAWRRPEVDRRVSWTFLAGFFVGLAIANKITAGVCGFALVLVLVLRPSTKARDVVFRVFVARAGMVAGCLLPILSFYKFSFEATSRAFRSWWSIVKSPRAFTPTSTDT